MDIPPKDPRGCNRHGHVITISFVLLAYMSAIMHDHSPQPVHPPRQTGLRSLDRPRQHITIL